MDKIEELLTRGVANIIPSREELEKKLRSGKKLRVYQGFDPTGDQLHIGHMVGLRKLKQLQELGHQVIFLIGDATVQAGDPSGKKTTRERLYKLIIESKEDRPGILRKIAEAFELEGVSMTTIDSNTAKGIIRFKVGIDKQTPTETITKTVGLLVGQGFSVTDEFRQNAKSYVEQAERIVSFKGKNPAEIRYNADWLNQLNLVEILNLAGHFSLQQLSERDLFQERLKRKETVNLREFLYPLLQAYDSVVMNIDLEIGGTDQTFNMLCGRTLVKAMQNREKFIMTMPLLADAAGNKIGKTERNAIAITDKPEDLFRKIMGLSDDVIARGLEYLTDLSVEEIKNIEQKIKNGENPIQYKKLLAFEIVKELNNEQAAKKAREHFEKTIQKKEQPEKMETHTLKKSEEKLADILVETKLASSKSDAQRLVEQGGVSIDGVKATDPNEVIKLKNERVIRAGKHRFAKIKSAS